MTRSFPLSYQQESLWYREVFTDRSGLTSVPVALRLRGSLDEPAMRRALLGLLDRHPALRTTFDAPGGVPSQRTGPAVLDLTVADVADDEDARRRGRAELARPFDLAVGPPIRFRLYRVAVDHHVLVVIAHHLVTDAASIGVMLTELGELYGAAVARRRPRLAQQSSSYADFVDAQRAGRDPRRIAELAAYWDEQLAGAPHEVDLVTERPRPRTRESLGGVVTEPVPASTLAAVRRLAAETRTSEFIVLLAAFRLLLWRHTGQRDALVGAPVSGRDHPGTEDVVGFFINLLVLRSPVDPRAGFRQLLAREREAVLGAFDHADMPYAEVVRRLRPDRDPSSSPLVQVTFSYRPDDDTTTRLPGLEVSDFWLHGTSLQFDLVFELLGGADEGLLLCGYNSDVFDPAAMAALTARYLPLLLAALAEPDRPVADLPWLLPADERLVAMAGRGPRSATAPSGLLDRLWLAPADAAAVRCGDARRTYGELRAGAAAVAARLRRLGLPPESVVGVVVDRRVDLPAALLGVLAAGHAFLPLDPRQPAERHAQLLADAGAGAVVSDRGDVAGLPAVAPTPAVAADPPGVPSAPHDDALAYVLYTSGSTGRPKGVAVTHAALRTAVGDAGDGLAMGQGRRLVTASTIAFDIALLEILLPLAYGGELILADTAEQSDPAALAALLDATRPDYFFATPARWHMLLHAGWSGDPAMTAMVGGDTLTPELAARVRALTARLWQMYGPTEATIFCTRDEVEPAPVATVMPIGRPITGATAYVLDDDLRPVAPGVVGELCVGGAALARGYLGDPAGTAAAFVPDPCGSMPGARLYRTGDLARLLPDGRFELRGRRDDQVKIRGHRIELGEIEAALRSHPDVAAAACVVVGETPETRRVVAYVETTRPDGDGVVAGVRDAMRRRLPQYLLPAGYAVLGRLPTTANGKIDRAALARSAGTAVPQPAGDEPVTEHERAVADVWAAALGVRRVGRSDDFFELGGNSLLGAQVIGELRARNGVRLPMSALIEDSTVAGFAQRVADASSTPVDGDGAHDGPRPLGGLSVTVLRSGRRVPRLVLAHPVGGSALCYREIVAALGGDWHVTTLECAESLDLGVPERAAAYLDRLGDDGTPTVFAGWSLGGLWAYETARQAAARGRRVPGVLVVDSALPDQFDWDAELAAGNAEWRFARETLRLAGSPRDIAELPADADPFAWLATALGSGDPTELADRFAVSRSVMAAARAYRPQPAALDLYAVEPEDDPVDVDGWAELVDTLTIHAVPGDHFAVIAGEGARAIAGILADLA